MIAIPLLILALAAGVYLLIKVSREYLGGIFKFLAWSVIVLSFLGIIGVVLHGAHHMRMMHRMHRMHGNMEIEKERVMIKGDMPCCGPEGCKMSCCEMKGDSMVMDKNMCIKMMGKDACEKMCRERGGCIMSKEECAKMCSGMGSAGGKMPCCMMGADTAKSCCKK